MTVATAGPPRARCVLQRLVVLQSVAVHATAAHDAGVVGAPHFRGSCTQLELRRLVREHRDRVRTLKETGLWAHATRDEKQLLRCHPTGLPEVESLIGSWSAEAAGVLAWALGRAPLHAWDELAAPDVLEADFLAGGIFRATATAHLRTPSELQLARERAELWHWRARNHYLENAGAPLPPGLTYPGIAREVAEGALADGLLDAIQGGDFAARGRPYRDLAGPDAFELAAIARERHHALNWLCGLAPRNRWDVTPLHT